MVFSCVGTGFTCDKGGIEIHLKINKKIVEKYFEKADVVPYGQKWGVKGEINVYYTEIYPVLLYVFDNGIRIQIAVKNFTVNEDLLDERCELWEDPKNLDAKEVTRKILNTLKDIGAIKLSSFKIEQVVRISDWGCSGNCWIDAKKTIPQRMMVRGCGGGEIFILKSWKDVKIEKNGKNIFLRAEFFGRVLGTDFRGIFSLNLKKSFIIDTSLKLK